MTKLEDTTKAAGGSPLERVVRPALGYKHHAKLVRNTGQHMETTAAFIETQNVEIERLRTAIGHVVEFAECGCITAGSRLCDMCRLLDALGPNVELSGLGRTEDK